MVSSHHRSTCIGRSGANHYTSKFCLPAYSFNSFTWLKSSGKYLVNATTHCVY